MKAQKKIEITYKIISQECLKSIVCGVKSFSDDDMALRFIKRLVKVKNALCMRSDSERYKQVVKEQKRYNKWDSVTNFNECGLPYLFSYTCKTI